MKEKTTKTRVLITGCDGQLGQCIRKIENYYSGFELYHTNSKTLDVTNKENVSQFFSDTSFDFIVNCAAYTNVEQAEKESEKAFLVNAKGVENLVQICKKKSSTLIHISTDYVFDGKKGSPYMEDDIPNPINEYGKSKLAGEIYIQKNLTKYFIIRTSWLYSEFGHNFFKTILKKSEIEKELTVTTSEIGTPTNANDLAKFILNIIQMNSSKYGIYHYSNLGEATWYDFAEEILRILGKLDSIILKKTDNYPTFAQRPKCSVLDKENSNKSFDQSILSWKGSLKQLIQR